jgi:uncharacterized protein (DUF362 family)
MSISDRNNEKKNKFLKSTRRDFIKKSAVISAGAFVFPTILTNTLSCSKKSSEKTKTEQLSASVSETQISDVAMVSGKYSTSPAQLVDKAIALLGGIGSFIEDGDIVLVKPNIGWASDVEDGANTHPKIVKKLVELCFEAGASYVYVADNSCNNAEDSYRLSGIQKILKDTPADVFIPRGRDFVTKNIGSDVGEMGVLQTALDVDKIINIPVAKHHSLATLTLGMKNLMGLLDSRRGGIHRKIHHKLPQLAQYFKPTLNIIDAYRVIVKYGPRGGSNDCVVRKNTVIASSDIVATDTLSAELFKGIKDGNSKTVSTFKNLNVSDLGFIKNGRNIGLGNSDKNKMKIKKAEI